MGYCPDCSASLEDGVTECWNCAAQFGPGSAWSPLASPSGKFREIKRTNTTNSNKVEGPRNSSATSWLFFFLMLIFGAISLFEWMLQFAARRASDNMILPFALSFFCGGIVIVLALLRKASDSARVAGFLCGILLIFT